MSDFVNDSTPVESQTTGVESNVNNDAVAEPSIVELKSDSLIKAEGFDKPVKFSELTRRQQADYTKKTQELARARQEWERERDSERQRLSQLATELLQRQRQGQGEPKNDFLDKLRAKTYLDGQTAAELLQEIQQNGFGTIQKEIGRRDEVITALYQQIQNLQRNFTSLQSERNNQSFETKISRWVNELGYEPEWNDLAKEIYLAYEGDDLDTEFPTIFKNRVEQIEKVLRTRDKKKVEAARSNPFRLPGKGGQGTTGKPIGLKGNESAKDTADHLWEMLQAADGEKS